MEFIEKIEHAREHKSYQELLDIIEQKGKEISEALAMLRGL